MARVVFDHVWKEYSGGVVAVRDASLIVEDGEFMVLVGPSGCGKSTSLRMVAGLEDISRGTISIDGRVVNDVPPKDRDIAMVFQNYALYPHMTVYDNMAFGLKMRKMPKPEIDTRVREAAELLELTELLQRKPKALSGGQRQRVAVGRAIVRRPKVFLFDEPLSNLDAKLRVQTRAEIVKLHRRLEATTIYVTHDQVEAMTMGSRITLMKDGIIQQIDTPLTIYREPVNQFVATFIGSPAMNLFPGRLEGTGSQRTFRFEALSLRLPFDAVDFPTNVTIGVRPEDLSVATASSGGDRVRLPATVDVVETLGAEAFVHARTGERPFVARIDSHHELRVGQQVDFTFDLAKLHPFDSDSGLALRPSLTRAT